MLSNYINLLIIIDECWDSGHKVGVTILIHEAIVLCQKKTITIFSKFEIVAQVATIN